ncbi:hypothetical protein HYU14_03130 [Candidatus Woesearchaeota archaeon]|nr:hypothetical protein [Candidatus Woesearchaeota archaeon]
MKVIVNNGQYKITIPKQLAQGRNWNGSTRLRFLETPTGEVFLQEIREN